MSGFLKKYLELAFRFTRSALRIYLLQCVEEVVIFARLKGQKAKRVRLCKLTIPTPSGTLMMPVMQYN
jgi:hypothetical protein